MADWKLITEENPPKGRVCLLHAYSLAALFLFLGLVAEGQAIWEPWPGVRLSKDTIRPSMITITLDSTAITGHSGTIKRDSSMTIMNVRPAVSLPDTAAVYILVGDPLSYLQGAFMIKGFRVGYDPNSYNYVWNGFSYFKTEFEGYHYLDVNYKPLPEYFIVFSSVQRKE